MTVKTHTIDLNKTLGTVVGMDCCSPAKKKAVRVKKNNNTIQEKSSSNKLFFPKLLTSK